jgi:excinuclease UvrABC ATPase subunit
MHIEARGVGESIDHDCPRVQWVFDAPSQGLHEQSSPYLVTLLWRSDRKPG